MQQGYGGYFSWDLNSTFLGKNLPQFYLFDTLGAAKFFGLSVNIWELSIKMHAFGNNLKFANNKAIKSDGFSGVFILNIFS